MKKIIIYFIQLYRATISTYLPTECRYYPTCSCYMAEAIEKKRYLEGYPVRFEKDFKMQSFVSWRV